ncbi:MAG: EAL domain-containing protein [Thalassospira sp.]|uniref:Histidine kinase n=1 Tax=Thalassospira tepidiphila MCCC 1A03514 TaxID=1177930 RepID=A0A853L3U5_9PROT|nr:EAL domain-containing protein [Thalassospira sp.]MBO6578816.1 EAL domain-containing protein [Thalassospira sp.]MBO6817327.1 EAL domain-containing protein [Thalassospira sp.]MBO6887859.1 EAL domain-containing protein [Thalassospira sp.]OAZ12000.1 histidine kinase [Thalassospira tepidiphila MCCC 1A03514]
MGIGLPEKGLDQQRLRWRDRLSVKQARIAVGLTLLIGLLFSGIQIVWDLREEQNLIDRTVNQVLATLRESATQAAYGLDETLAARVISGLFEYEPVYEAELRDNFKNVLARKTEKPINSNRTFLTQIMFGENQEYEIPLNTDGPNGLVGHLSVKIDTDMIAEGFINRASRILLSGIVRNLLLGLVLVAFFYITLTKPLLGIAAQLRQIDPEKPDSAAINIPPHHARNELGMILQTTRGLVERVSSTLDRLLESQQKVRDRESRLSAIVQNVADGILTITPTGRIIECNAATKEILGLMRDETPKGRTLHEFLLPRAVPLLEHSLEELAAHAPGAEAVEKRFTLPIVRADQKEIDVSIALRLIPDSATPLMTAVLNDITVRKRYEEQLVYMANHDTLTNLPNRSMLERSLSEALNTHKNNASERSGATAILFIDLDRFKVINDSLGHDVGDLMLKAVALRLQRVIGRQEIVGRLGGDEFLIIIPDLKETQDAVILSQAVLDALAPAFDIKGRVLFVTPSIGIALYPSDGEDFPALMRNADTAMYSAKSSGGGTYHFFTKTMNESAMARLVIENDLREALVKDEFELHYQPKVDLRTNQVCGLEALIRWKQPGRGYISPMQFIPVAEETGLISRIGEWVFREVCRQISEWEAQSLPPMPIAVNLSPRQLIEGHITETISRILAETATPAARIVLEVTETAMMQEIKKAATILDELRHLGLKIAVDDFGTGYSSLAYLKRLPINSIKIDRSFVRDVTIDTDDAAITRTIIAMGHNLGLKVVAEGVETQEQMNFLRECNCDEVQGFLIATPLPPEEIVQYIRRPSIDIPSEI